MRRRHGIAIAPFEQRPRGVVGGQTGEIGRHVGIGQLRLGAGDHPHPGDAGVGERREHDDVVEHDGVGLQPRQQLAERRFRAYRRVDDRLPGRADIGVELIQRGQVEMRQVPAHEGLPGVRPPLGRGGGQVMLGKAVVGEQAGEAGVADEDRPRAALAQRLRDTDAVQRGAEARFRKESDGRRGPRSHLPFRSPAAAGRTGAPRLAACGRWLRDSRRCSRIEIRRRLELPAFELVEYGEMFPRRLL